MNGIHCILIYVRTNQSVNTNRKWIFAINNSRHPHVIDDVHKALSEFFLYPPTPNKHIVSKKNLGAGKKVVICDFLDS